MSALDNLLTSCVIRNLSQNGESFSSSGISLHVAIKLLHLQSSFSLPLNNTFSFIIPNKEFLNDAEALSISLITTTFASVIGESTLYLFVVVKASKSTLPFTALDLVPSSVSRRNKSLFPIVPKEAFAKSITEAVLATPGGPINNIGVFTASPRAITLNVSNFFIKFVEIVLVIMVFNLNSYLFS